MEKEIIIIQTPNQKFSIQKHLLCYSKYFKEILIKNTRKIIQIEVDSTIMSLVIDYLKKLDNNNPIEIKFPVSKKIFENPENWGFRFLSEIPMNQLINLTSFSKFLGINSLFELCCGRIAFLCLGKKEGDILKLFNDNDFTEKEKNKIKEENKWLNE